MTQSTIFLARHGETAWNVEKRIQGQLDSELTDVGITQAYELADNAAKFNVSKIYCSRLDRAKKTASISAQHLNVPIEVIDGIEERHFGLWQGAQFDSLSREPHFYEIFEQVTDHKPPEGETAQQACSRFLRSIKSLVSSHPNEQLLVISHGDIMRCFLNSLIQNSFGDAYQQFKNGCITPLNYCHLTKTFSVK